MKSTKYYWFVILCLLAVITVGVIKFVVVGSTTAPTGVDQRTVVNLSESERQAVLLEMRMLLEATQQVVNGLANNDLAAIAKVSQAVGISALSTMDVTLKAKLPLDFKKLGFATHQAFDEISVMALQGQPENMIQLKLADTMNNCLACHAMYQIPSMMAERGQ